eukprot:2448734-Pleurochrysis_carterae.AAC.1
MSEVRNSPIAVALGQPFIRSCAKGSSSPNLRASRMSTAQANLADGRVHTWPKRQAPSKATQGRRERKSVGG